MTTPRGLIQGLLFTGLCLLGAATVYAGGADDSPGLQGIGLLLITLGVRALVRLGLQRRTSRGPSPD